MRTVTFRGICASLIIAANVLISMSASAALITYEYSFDTPVFSSPELAGLNTIFTTAGPTITGTLSYDLGDTDPSGNTLLSRSWAPTPGSGSFTHSGELDSLFSGPAMTSLWVYYSLPGVLTEWREYHPNGGHYFFIDLYSRLYSGECKYQASTSIPSDPCGSGEGTFDESASMQNFSLQRIEKVPVPATLALFSLGLASLAWSRRRA